MCLCGYACRYFPFYRGRRALENRTNLDDDKIEMLEQMLKDATESANESERKYEEVRFLFQGKHLIPPHFFLRVFARNLQKPLYRTILEQQCLFVNSHQQLRLHKNKKEPKITRKEEQGYLQEDKLTLFLGKGFASFLH